MISTVIGVPSDATTCVRPLAYNRSASNCAIRSVMYACLVFERNQHRCAAVHRALMRPQRTGDRIGVSKLPICLDENCIRHPVDQPPEIELTVTVALLQCNRFLCYLTVQDQAPYQENEPQDCNAAVYQQRPPRRAEDHGFTGVTFGTRRRFEYVRNDHQHANRQNHTTRHRMANGSYGPTTVFGTVGMLRHFSPLPAHARPFSSLDVVYNKRPNGSNIAHMRTQFFFLFFLLRFCCGFGKVASVFYVSLTQDRTCRDFDRQQHEHTRQQV